MDCLRCGEEVDDDTDFCWFCGWAFIGDSIICSTCNQTIKRYEECGGCTDESDRDTYTSSELDDWHHLTEET